MLLKHKPESTSLLKNHWVNAYRIKQIPLHEFTALPNLVTTYCILLTYPPATYCTTQTHQITRSLQAAIFPCNYFPSPKHTNKNIFFTP